MTTNKDGKDKKSPLGTFIAINSNFKNQSSKTVRIHFKGPGKQEQIRQTRWMKRRKSEQKRKGNRQKVRERQILISKGKTLTQLPKEPINRGGL